MLIRFVKGVLFSKGRYTNGVFSAKNGIQKVRGRTSERSLPVLIFLEPPGKKPFLSKSIGRC